MTIYEMGVRERPNPATWRLPITSQLEEGEGRRTPLPAGGPPVERGMANTLKMAEVCAIYALLERGWSQRRIARTL